MRGKRENKLFIFSYSLCWQGPRWFVRLSKIFVSLKLDVFYWLNVFVLELYLIGSD